MCDAADRLAHTPIRPGPNGTKTASELLALFADDGIEAYVCGGAVRDALLGRASTDIDLVVGLPIALIRDRVVRAFGETSIRLYNPTFGLLTVGGDAASAVDITMFHDPDDITEQDTFIMDVAFSSRGTLAKDARSRDLTMNAVYWNRIRGFVDPSGFGISDIAARCLRISAAPEKLRVDPRMSFRMLVFVERGFELTDETATFLESRLEVDIETFPHAVFDSFIAETVHGDPLLASKLLERARPHVRKARSWQRLERACLRV